MARFQDWDYFNKNVQSGLTEGQFINFGGCLLAAGPPYLSAPAAGGQDDDTVGGQQVFPVGLASNWAIQHQLTAIPVPEAGSYRRYTITGPADGNFSMGRTLYHGPSLLRVMYAYYSAPRDDGGATPVIPLTDDASANALRNPKNLIIDAPGYENFWVNLASDIFTQPVGLLLYIKDVNREAYGAVYLEQLQVVNHGFGSGPGQVAVAENAAFLFSRARPVKLNQAVPLMSRHEHAGTITVAGTENTTGPNGPQRIPAPTGSNI